MNNPRRMRLAIALGVVTLGACAPTMMVNQASEEQAIRAVANEYMVAFNAHDPDRLVALHAPDAVVMVSNSPLASGSSAIRSSFADFFKTGAPSLSFTPTRIDVASPTVATDVGTYTLTLDTPQGKVTDRGNYTTVWHKINGQWRIAVDAPVSSTPMPMAGMAGMPGMAMEMADLQMLAGSGLTWSDFRPAGFDPGAGAGIGLAGPPGRRDGGAVPPEAGWAGVTPGRAPATPGRTACGAASSNSTTSRPVSWMLISLDRATTLPVASRWRGLRPDAMPSERSLACLASGRSTHTLRVSARRD